MINLLDPERIRKQRVALVGFLRGAKMPAAQAVLYFAEKYHNGIRKDKITPEFTHQVQIALYLTTLDLSPSGLETAIIAALAHDLFEDHPEVTLEMIGQECNYSPSPETATPQRPYSPSFTQGLASAMTLSKIRNGQKIPQAQYLEEIARDRYAALVKGADRINNFQSMSGVFPDEKQKGYLEEGMGIIACVKNARKRFPSMVNAFYNIEFVLKSQVELISIMLDIHPARKPTKPTP